MSGGGSGVAEEASPLSGGLIRVARELGAAFLEGRDVPAESALADALIAAVEEWERERATEGEIEAARALWGDEGALEIDDGAAASRAADGYWVSAWVRVDVEVSERSCPACGGEGFIGGIRRMIGGRVREQEAECQECSGSGLVPARGETEGETETGRRVGEGR